MIRTSLLAIASVAALATPALADLTVGQIHYIDADARSIVMGDRTVWILPAKMELKTFAVGDRVLISYRTAGEDGLVAIDDVTLVLPLNTATTKPGA